MSDLRLVPIAPAANDRARSELSRVEEELAHARTEATYWQDSWIELLGHIGDLLQTAKARPKGRRFATVLELSILLTQAGPGDDS